MPHLLVKIGGKLPNESRPINWYVRYRYNDREYSKGFEFLTLAELEMIKLEAYGMKPSLHKASSDGVEQEFVRHTYGL